MHYLQNLLRYMVPVQEGVFSHAGIPIGFRIVVDNNNADVINNANQTIIAKS